MATTGLDIVTRALRRLGQIANDETPSADEARGMLDGLNAMMAGWETLGLDLTEVTPRPVTEVSAFPFPAGHEHAVIALLAVRMAEDYGQQTGPTLQRDAYVGWLALQSAYMPVPDSVFDPAGVQTPGRGRAGAW